MKIPPHKIKNQPTPTLTLPLKGREHGSSPFNGEVGRGMGANVGDMINGILRISNSLTQVRVIPALRQAQDKLFFRTGRKVGLMDYPG